MPNFWSSSRVTEILNRQKPVTWWVNSRISLINRYHGLSFSNMRYFNLSMSVRFYLFISTMMYQINCLAEDSSAFDRARSSPNPTRSAATLVQQPNPATRQLAGLLDRWRRLAMSDPSRREQSERKQLPVHRAIGVRRLLRKPGNARHTHWWARQPKPTRDVWTLSKLQVIKIIVL